MKSSIVFNNNCFIRILVNLHEQIPRFPLVTLILQTEIQRFGAQESGIRVSVSCDSHTCTCTYFQDKLWFKELSVKVAGHFAASQLTAGVWPRFFLLRETEPRQITAAAETFSHLSALIVVWNFEIRTKLSLERQCSETCYCDQDESKYYLPYVHFSCTITNISAQIKFHSHMLHAVLWISQGTGMLIIDKITVC